MNQSIRLRLKKIISMKTLSSEQMLSHEAGRAIDWCAVGEGVTAIGGALNAAGVAFCCPAAGAAYAAIAITTFLCC